MFDVFARYAEMITLSVEFQSNTDNPFTNYCSFKMKYYSLNKKWNKCRATKLTNQSVLCHLSEYLSLSWEPSQEEDMYC